MSVPLMEDQNPHNLAVGSEIQYNGIYGMIRWMGLPPGHNRFIAGLEMVW